MQKPVSFEQAVKQRNKEDNFWKKYLKNCAEIDEEQIHKMVNLIDNSWGNYYKNCKAEIKGWIDFENEMKPVLGVF